MSLELTIAWRDEPAPLSLAFMTVNVEEHLAALEVFQERPAAEAPRGEWSVAKGTPGSRTGEAGVRTVVGMAETWLAISSSWGCSNQAILALVEFVTRRPNLQEPRGSSVGSLIRRIGSASRKVLSPFARH